MRKNSNRKLGSGDPDLGNTPPRTTAENFKLNIDENDIGATGAVDTGNRRRGRHESPPNNKTYYTEKERRKEEKEHKKRDRLKAGKNKRVFRFMWLAMVLLVSLTVASYFIDGANDLLAAGRPEADVEIKVPKEVSNEEMSQILYEKGVISKKEFFKLYCDLLKVDNTFVEGTYQLKTNLDYEDIKNRLQGAVDSRITVDVTVTEGMNVFDVATLLEDNKVCDQKEFLEMLNSRDFDNYSVAADLGDATNRYYRLEGYLFPDTYTFYLAEDVKSVVGKMLNNFQAKMSSIKTSLDESGMTLDQAVNMASIIQKEAADAKDMYNVASVLHNRLEYGADYDITRLDCDSTMYYPHKTKADAPAGYTSQYNTYEITGLPAGPIANPGLDAIQSAITPNATDYLYFCHDKEGKAYYASNMYDHQYNLELAGLTSDATE